MQATDKELKILVGIVKEGLSKNLKLEFLKEERRNLTKRLNESSGEGDYYDDATEMDEAISGIVNKIKSAFTPSDRVTPEMSDEQISQAFKTTAQKNGKATREWMDINHPAFEQAKAFAIDNKSANIYWNPNAGQFMSWGTTKVPYAGDKVAYGGAGGHTFGGTNEEINETRKVTKKITKK